VWLPKYGSGASTSALGATREIETFGVGVSVDCNFALASLTGYLQRSAQKRATDATTGCARKDPESIKFPRLDSRVQLDNANKRAGLILGYEGWPSRDCVGREGEIGFPELKLFERVAPTTLGGESQLRKGFVLAGKCTTDVHVRPNVRGEAGPTAQGQAREAHDRPERLAGLVLCRWASPRPRG
jgi:hypothetical protein